MIKEKSCGAVVYRLENEMLEILVIHQVQGHWCFPKGHVETGEAEAQTALREVREETGLLIHLQDGFRETTSYSPTPGVVKQVVYFLAKPEGGEEKVQEEELLDMKWVRPVQAMAALTYGDDASLLRKALRYIKVSEPGIEDYL